MNHTSTAQTAAERFRLAEQQGLKLAIVCRTGIASFGLAYLLSIDAFTNYDIRVWSLVALLIIIVTGVAHISVIGTTLDRWWLKFLIYLIDVLIICGLFVVIPISRADTVPQIIAFRAYGIYYLFPILVLSALSLSWRLVIWTGVNAVAGWWAAFLWVVSGMTNTLSWADIPPEATVRHYEDIFLSMDFIGRGNRIEETGFLFAASLILALVVYRAKSVFFAQIAAEENERAERDARLEVTKTLNRFVPSEISDQIIAQGGALKPRQSRGAVLILDIAGFSKYAAARSAEQVINTLDQFLSVCSDIVGKNSGVVISFTGDGLLATFNIPLSIEDPEVHAANTAQELVSTAGTLNFQVRIGIATGDIASGSIGSDERMAFTVYGDAVNRAARMEALGKDLQQTIIMDHQTRANLKDKFDLVELGEHKLRGLDSRQRLYSIRVPG